MRTGRHVLVVGLLATTTALFGGAPASAGQQQPVDPASAQALLSRYCITCHSERLKTGGLSLG